MSDAEGFGLKIVDETADLPTNDPAAFDAYAEGAFHYWALDPARAETAIAHLERATTLAPGFVEAQVMLANALLYAASHQVGTREPEAAALAAERALLSAVRAAPAMPTVQASLGDLQLCMLRKPAEAKESFAAALLLDPDTAHQGVARYHIARGDLDAAARFIERSVEAAPDDLWTLGVAAQNFVSIGAYSKAIETAEQGLALDRNAMEPARAKALALMLEGDQAAATEVLRELQKTYPENARVNLTLARALGAAGGKEEASELARDVLDQRRAPALQRAIAYLVLGANDDALRELGSAFREREFGLCYLSTDPVWLPLRGKEEFERLAEHYQIEEQPGGPLR